MAFPSAIDTYTPVAGTTLVADADHANMHNIVGSAVVGIETTLGTNSGTSVLKNMTSGNFAARVNNETFGTPLITGGTANSQVIGTPNITGGTWSTGFLGTPTINGGSIALQGTVTPLTFGGAIVPSLGSVADAPAGTITVNAQQSNVFYTVLGTTAGNRTIGTPRNPTALEVITYGFQTSGSANGTLIWDSGAFTLSQDYGTPALGTSTAWHWFSWRRNPVSNKWDFQGASKNLI